MLVVIPLPDRDFDPTEVAVSWDVLRGAGIATEFKTLVTDYIERRFARTAAAAE